jgi:hypothetical protein
MPSIEKCSPQPLNVVLQLQVQNPCKLNNNILFTNYQ